MSSHTKQHDSEPAGRSHGMVILATILSFFVPGLGLALLGRWSMAAANIILATTVVAGCWFGQNPTIIEHIHWVVFVVMIGSAAIAHGVATSPS